MTLSEKDKSDEATFAEANLLQRINILLNEQETVINKSYSSLEPIICFPCAGTLTMNNVGKALNVLKEWAGKELEEYKIGVLQKGSYESFNPNPKL